MSAGVSKDLRSAEVECPTHRTGLRRLQDIIDDLTIEVNVIGLTVQDMMRASSQVPARVMHWLNNSKGYHWLHPSNHLAKVRWFIGR